jgi:hypothetical protein
LQADAKRGFRLERLIHWGWVAAAALSVIALILVWKYSPLFSGDPVQWEVKGSRLVTRDSEGRTAWSYLLPAVPYVPDQASLRQDSASDPPLFADLDGDGANEFLYAFHRSQDSPGTDVLYCFDRRGALLWTYTPGREVATRSESFRPPFIIRILRTIPRAGAKGHNVVLSSHHATLYPNQVLILTPEGRPLREYWHSGHFNHMAATDYNGDSRLELVFIGIANSHSLATLVILDPDRLDGASREENPDYQLEGFRPGVELVRLLFPATSFSRTQRRYNAPYEVRADGGHVTVALREDYAGSNCTTTYTFGPGLRFDSLSFGDTCVTDYRNAHAKGLIPFAHPEEERAKLLSGFRYLVR